MEIRHRIGGLLSIMILLFVITGCRAGAADGEPPVEAAPIAVSGISPAPVSADRLRPGLDAFYYVKFFERHLMHLPTTETSEYRSFRGRPVTQLNHQFGDGKVFGSGTSRGVGMRLRGYLSFSKTGVYDLQALSNDGVIMYVDNKLALNDPEQHSDRLSNVAHVTIDTPGWYPVVIEYFQRKGTAALKLFWRTPGSPEFVPVAESAYAHGI